MTKDNENIITYSSKEGLTIRLVKIPNASEVVLLSTIVATVVATTVTSAALSGAKYVTTNYAWPGLQYTASYTWNTVMPAVGSATKYVTTEYALPAAQGLFSYAYNWYCQPASLEVVLTMNSVATPAEGPSTEQEEEFHDALDTMSSITDEFHSMKEEIDSISIARQAVIAELKEQQAVNTSLQEVTVQLASQEKAVGA